MFAHLYPWSWMPIKRLKEVCRRSYTRHTFRLCLSRSVYRTKAVKIVLIWLLRITSHSDGSHSGLWILIIWRSAGDHYQISITTCNTASRVNGESYLGNYTGGDKNAPRSDRKTPKRMAVSFHMSSPCKCQATSEAYQLWKRRARGGAEVVHCAWQRGEEGCC